MPAGLFLDSFRDILGACGSHVDLDGYASNFDMDDLSTSGGVSSIVMVEAEPFILAACRQAASGEARDIQHLAGLFPQLQRTFSALAAERDNHFRRAFLGNGDESCASSNHATCCVSR